MNDSEIKDREIDNIKNTLKTTGAIITIAGVIYAFFLYNTDNIILCVSIAVGSYVFSLLLWTISVLIDLLIRIERNTQNRNNI